MTLSRGISFVSIGVDVFAAFSFLVAFGATFALGVIPAFDATSAFGAISALGARISFPTIFLRFLRTGLLTGFSISGLTRIFLASRTTGTATGLAMGLAMGLTAGGVGSTHSLPMLSSSMSSLGYREVT